MNKTPKFLPLGLPLLSWLHAPYPTHPPIDILLFPEKRFGFAFLHFEVPRQELAQFVASFCKSGFTGTQPHVFVYRLSVLLLYGRGQPQWFWQRPHDSTKFQLLIIRFLVELFLNPCPNDWQLLMSIINLQLHIDPAVPVLEKQTKPFPLGSEPHVRAPQGREEPGQSWGSCFFLATGVFLFLLPD